MRIIAWIKRIVSGTPDAKLLILVRGVPGSGKSTLSAEIAKAGNYPVLAADDYFMTTGIYIFPKFPNIKDALDNLTSHHDIPFIDWLNTLKKVKEDNDKIAGAARHQLYLAHKNCQDRCRNAMIVGERMVIVNNTSTKSKDLKPYTDMAKTHGYMVFSIVVENRHGGTNVHDVPVDVVERMANELSNSIKLR